MQCNFFQLIKREVVQNVNRMSKRQIRRLFILVIKTKVVQNVNRMLERETDGQTNRHFSDVFVEVLTCVITVPCSRLC